MQFDVVYGVDFSGAKLAGRNIWLAETLPSPRGKLRLARLESLEKLCGTAERQPALAHLVNLISSSHSSLWGIDFPFGLPIEVVHEGPRWPHQFHFISQWSHDPYALGLECLRRAKSIGREMHIRRQTDSETKAPFDCYHYRIIYQFYHGMADVIAPLTRTRRTAILPFHYRRLSTAQRVVAESCPSSTLKRLKLPYQNYKQPTGGPLTPKRRRTRHAILHSLRRFIQIPPHHQRRIMRNPGGDALDAVIAAVGVHQAWQHSDHRAIARHPRYPREGFIYS